MKKQLRKDILKARINLDAALVEELSDEIFYNIKDNHLLDDYDAILIYMDFRNEVKTKKIIDHCLSLDKRVILPVVDFSTMELTLVEIKSMKDDMTLSDYGILEPIIRDDNVVDPKIIELVLAPGVAFDESGYRIGYGGGFYDKLLSRMNNKTKIIALAFEMQMIDRVPYESHDKVMDAIVTELRFISTTK